jgi:hypothetical protein
LAAGTYSYRWYANDTVGNNNSTGILAYIVNKTNPSSYLNLSLNGTEADLEIVYGSSSNATGWSTLADTQDLTFDLYKNGSFVMSGNPANNTGILGVGTYAYVYNTTGGANYTNGTSPVRILNITQSATYVNLSLNGFEDNTTVIYPQTITAVFSTNALTATMYRNATPINGENNTAKTLAAGYYNYTVINLGDANYTGSNKTFFATVNKNISTCSLAFNLPSPQNYSTPINASCSCTNPEASATLWRNGNNVTSAENNKFVNLSVATHNYVCNVIATQNYTSATTTSNYIINKSDPSSNLRLALNGVEGNWTITYGTQSNATGWSTLPSNQDLIFNLSRNGTSVASGNPASEITTLGAGTYTYVYNTTGGANYTNGTSPVRILNVTKAEPSLTLNVLPGLNVIVGTQTNVICAADTPQVTPLLYKNGILLPNLSDVAILPVGIYNYTCNSTATQNYTAKSVSKILTVTNTAPNTTNVIVNTSLGLNSSEENISCYAKGNDNEQSSLTSYYIWYNNITLFSSGNASVLNNTLTLLNTIDKSQTSVGDNWTCSVKMSDGYANETDWNNASVLLISYCGNSIKEQGEVCDGTDLDDKKCKDFGFDKGELVCSQNCTAFNTSGCKKEQGGGGGRTAGPGPSLCTPLYDCEWSSCESGSQNLVCDDRYNCEELLNKHEVQGITPVEEPTGTRICEIAPVVPEEKAPEKEAPITVEQIKEEICKLPLWLAFLIIILFSIHAYSFNRHYDEIRSGNKRTGKYLGWAIAGFALLALFTLITYLLCKGISADHIVFTIPIILATIMCIFTFHYRVP